jgi:hypothetical protein
MELPSPVREYLRNRAGQGHLDDARLHSASGPGETGEERSRYRRRATGPTPRLPMCGDDAVTQRLQHICSRAWMRTSLMRCLETLGGFIMRSGLRRPRVVCHCYGCGRVRRARGSGFSPLGPMAAKANGERQLMVSGPLLQLGKVTAGLTRFQRPQDLATIT